MQNDYTSLNNLSPSSTMIVSFLISPRISREGVRLPGGLLMVALAALAPGPYGYEVDEHEERWARVHSPDRSATCEKTSRSMVS